MSEPIVEKLAAVDVTEADLIWLQAFRLGKLPGIPGLRQFHDRFSDRIDRYVLRTQEGLQAVFEVVNTPLHFGPRSVLPAAYISSIACLPASRGRGYAAAGLKHILAELRDAGKVFTTLCPFDFAFYRRMGWEWLGPATCYKAPSHLLPVASETAAVRLARIIEDRPAIIKTYEQFARRYRGMIVRDDRAWSYVLEDRDDEATYAYLFEREGVVEGYLIMRGGSAEETSIPEFIAGTPAAQRAFLGLLRRHEMQTRKFSWEAPPDDGLWSQFHHKELETTLATFAQGRVVDVPAALRAWRPHPDARGSFVVSVRDEFAPWNTGRWNVSFESGEVSVSASGQEPAVEMDIQAFTQAFAGVLTPSVLRTQERIVVHDERGLHALGGLVAGPPFWMVS